MKRLIERFYDFNSINIKLEFLTGLLHILIDFISPRLVLHLNKINNALINMDIKTPQESGSQRLMETANMGGNEAVDEAIRIIMGTG
jgi:hypothetical protein